MKKIVRKVPIPLGGLALAFAALGILHVPWFPVMKIVCGIISLTALTLVVLKIFMFKGEFLKDTNNPMIAGVIPIIFIALGVLDTYIAHIYPLIAQVIWLFCVAMMLIFIMWFLVKYVCLSFKLNGVFTSWYIPFVGLCVMAWVSPIFGFETLGYYLFIAGFTTNVLVSIPIFYRYLTIASPEPAQPMFAIFPAPFSATIAAYLAVAQDEINLAVVGGLLFISQLLFILTLIKLPSFLSRPFYPSWVGLTFPFVITSSMLMKTTFLFRDHGLSIPQMFDYVFYAEIIFATVMVFYVGAKYFAFMIKSQPQEAAENKSSVAL